MTQANSRPKLIWKMLDDALEHNRKNERKLSSKSTKVVIVKLFLVTTLMMRSSIIIPLTSALLVVNFLLVCAFEDHMSGTTASEHF